MPERITLDPDPSILTSLMEGWEQLKPVLFNISGGGGAARWAVHFGLSPVLDADGQRNWTGWAPGLGPLDPKIPHEHIESATADLVGRIVDAALLNSELGDRKQPIVRARVVDPFGFQAFGRMGQKLDSITVRVNHMAPEAVQSWHEVDQVLARAMPLADGLGLVFHLDVVCSGRDQPVMIASRLEARAGLAPGYAVRVAASQAIHERHTLLLKQPFSDRLTPEGFRRCCELTRLLDALR